MADIDPEPEDFAAAEATVGPLPGENGSPAEARIRYEVARAHKLVRVLKDTAQHIRERGGGAARRSERKKRSRC